MNVEALYPQVTSAIMEAEALDARGDPKAKLAHLEVSRLEEEVASLLPASDIEGALARSSAVGAAIAGGDLARARRLAEFYLQEPEASEALREDLQESLKLSTPSPIEVTTDVAEATQEIGVSPLWETGTSPEPVEMRWPHRLAEALPQSIGWDAWIDWNEIRLKGGPVLEGIELVYAAVPKEEWDKGPAAANAWIEARLAARRGVPPQLPATLEPVIVNGEIVLLAASAEAELDDKGVAAAMHALRSRIEELARDVESETNIDPRASGYLRSFASKIPLASPNQAELFALAHEQETLERYADIVSAEWPSLLAERYLASTRAFGRTLRQFPKWRAFRQNAHKNRPSDVAAAAQLAADFADALAEEARGFVVPEIPGMLAEMSKSLDSIRDETCEERLPAGAGTLAEDAVTSVENVLKTIAEAALKGAGDTARGYAEELGKIAVEQTMKEGRKDGLAPVKWAKRTLVAAGAAGAGKATGLAAAIAQTMEHYPQIAAWLRPIIDHLK